MFFVTINLRVTIISKIGSNYFDMSITLKQGKLFMLNVQPMILVASYTPEAL